MGAQLPATEHVARALLRSGARDAAIELLRATVARDPADKGCGLLLRAVEARPSGPVYGPDVELDFDLTDGYVTRGMLREALAVLRGGRLDVVPRGRDKAALLEELLAPFPADADPQLRQVHGLLLVGGATLALSLLEERESAAGLPAWAVRRRELLRRLLFDSMVFAPTQMEAVAPGAESFVEEPAVAAPAGVSRQIADHVSSRNLPAALEAARRHATANPGDELAHALVEALVRLVRAIEKNVELPEDTLRTMPMSGLTIADLHVRMGNFAEAERLYRKLLAEESSNHVARERIADVQTVRRVMEGPAPAGHAARQRRDTDLAEQRKRQAAAPAAPALDSAALDSGALDLDVDLDFLAPPPLAPPVQQAAPPPIAAAPFAGQDVMGDDTLRTPRARTASSEVILKKREPRPTGEEEWSRPRPAYVESETDPSTAITAPDVQAELLLKKGYADRAIRIYLSLAARHPHEPRYAARAKEIAALAERAASPSPSDVTVKRDMSSLAIEARPTSTRLPQQQAPRPAPAPAEPSTWEEEEPTAVRDESGSQRIQEAISRAQAATGAPAVAVHRIVTVRD